MNANPAYRMRARADAVEATRERLLRAAAAAFSERPYDDVTIAAIARDAGVSHQTLLNHFGTKEGLYLASVEVFAGRIAELRSTAVAGDPDSVVGALMAQYEQFGDGNVRAAVLDERSPTVAATMRMARGYHQGWLTDMFGERLPPAGAARREALAELHVATDVFTWKLLRRDLGLSRRATKKTMTRLVNAVLAPMPVKTRSSP
jgi:AcrR family transcriptional regulator